MKKKTFGNKQNREFEKKDSPSISRGESIWSREKCNSRFFHPLPFPPLPSLASAPVLYPELRLPLESDLMPLNNALSGKQTHSNALPTFLLGLGTITCVPVFSQWCMRREMRSPAFMADNEASHDRKRNRMFLRVLFPPVLRSYAHLREGKINDSLAKN